MTNGEKHLYEILARCGCREIACLREGKEINYVVACAEQDSCGECYEKNIEWLKAEYKEPEHTHKECVYCKDIEGICTVNYCSKRWHTINGAETINGCKDFENV